MHNFPQAFGLLFLRPRFVPSFREKALFIVGVGVFCTLFLFVFQPFGTWSFQHEHKGLFLLGYGVIAIGGLGALEILLPLWLRWSRMLQEGELYKRVAHHFLTYFITLIPAYYYNRWFQGLDASFGDALRFFLYGISLGIFPLSFLVGFYWYRRRRERSLADAPKELLLEGEGKDEQLKLPREAIHYLKAAGNYVEVHYSSNGSLKSLLLRSPLRKVGDQLPWNFLQCHRSYVINLDHVVRGVGDQLRYRVELLHIEERIPVSREKVEELKERMKNSSPI